MKKKEQNVIQNEEKYRGMVWKKTDGTELPIEEMSPEHIQNTLMLLDRRHNASGGGSYNDKLEWVPKEKTKTHLAIDAMHRVHVARAEAERETLMGKLAPLVKRCLNLLSCSWKRDKKTTRRMDTLADSPRLGEVDGRREELRVYYTN